MVSPVPAVDVPPQPWTGRFDGDGDEHRRWWQAVTPYAPLTVPAGSPAARSAVILGFGSDAGVRRNKGRTGAAAAPAAIRAALGPLAFHLARGVHDAGDVTVAGDSLEARALWARVRADDVRWSLPSDQLLYGLSMSPDGSLIAEGGSSMEVRLLDPVTLERRALGRHEEQLKEVAFAPDGGGLYTLSEGEKQPLYFTELKTALP